MVGHKKTYARGTWKDQAAFEFIVSEYNIPDAVAERGMDAIINWANEAKGFVPLVALGTALYKLAEAKEFEKQAPKVAISVDATLSYSGSLFDKMQLFSDGSRRAHGKILNKEFEVSGGAQSRLTIPTSLIKSVVRSNKTNFLFTYLDDTSCVGDLTTDPICILVDEGIISHSPKILNISKRKIKFILGSATEAEAASGDDGPDILTTIIGLLAKK